MVLNEAINRQMKNKVEKYEKIHYNSNSKCADYEKVVCSLLNDYRGSRFEFHTRTQIVDTQM